MASYRGHLMFSTALGAGYGAAAFWLGDLHWLAALLGAGLTSASGLLPDLDSDSGVPVRVLFGGAAILTPALLLTRILALGLPLLQTVLLLAGIALVIRYPFAALFKRLTVHRGMFHSIPGMFISGLLVFLGLHHSDVGVRFFMAGGTMIGFLSHLVLDELCSVNFEGAKIHLNKAAGSALKLFSSSRSASLVAYGILAGLTFLAWPDLQSIGRQPFMQDGWRVAGGRVLEKMGLGRTAK
jgi:LexA-binding, inner membrane-associated putative hydrolase